MPDKPDQEPKKKYEPQDEPNIPGQGEPVPAKAGRPEAGPGPVPGARRTAPL